MEWPPPKGLSPMFDRWVSETARKMELSEDEVRRGRAAKNFAIQIGIYKE